MRVASDLSGIAIATPRLVLRAPRPADVDAVVDELNDYAVSRWLARAPHPYTRADAEGWVARASEALAAGRDLGLAIVREDAPIGAIGLHGLPDVGEFGYWLGRKWWGRGLATEAARAILAHAFDRLGVEQVRSGVFVGNEASLRLQMRLGFEETGRSRRFALARGEDVEHIDTVLTRARFRENRP